MRLAVAAARSAERAGANSVVRTGVGCKLMPQFQAQVPDPLRDQLPGTPVPRPSDCTSDRGHVPDLHRQSAGSKAPRCRYSSTTSEAVNACCGKLGEEEFVDDALRA